MIKISNIGHSQCWFVRTSLVLKVFNKKDVSKPARNIIPSRGVGLVLATLSKKLFYFERLLLWGPLQPTDLNSLWCTHFLVRSILVNLHSHLFPSSLSRILRPPYGSYTPFPNNKHFRKFSFQLFSHLLTRLPSSFDALCACFTLLGVIQSGSFPIL